MRRSACSSQLHGEIRVIATMMSDVHTLRFIGRARDLGFPIDEIRQLLALWHDRSRSSADVKALALARAAELKRKARELDAMRDALERLATDFRGDHRPDCPILLDLEGEPVTGLEVERLRP